MNVTWGLVVIFIVSRQGPIVGSVDLSPVWGLSLNVTLFIITNVGHFKRHLSTNVVNSHSYLRSPFFHLFSMVEGQINNVRHTRHDVRVRFGPLLTFYDVLSNEVASLLSNVNRSHRVARMNIFLGQATYLSPLTFFSYHGLNLIFFIIKRLLGNGQ